MSNYSGNSQARVPVPEFHLWYYIIEGVLGFLTVIGNGFVVFLISTRRHLQVNHNFYIVSLALADFLLGISLPTFSILCSYCMKCDWLAFYKFFNFFAFSSVANLCLMTFDRYFAIIYPLIYINRMTKKVLIASVAIAWFVTAVLAMLPFIWMYDADKTIVKKYNDAYYLTLLVVFELIPLVTMPIAYFRIFNVVRKHSIQVTTQRDQLSYNNHQLEMKDSKESTTSSNENHGRNDEGKETKKKKSSIFPLDNDAGRSSIIVLGLVILLFSLCWAYDIYITLCTRVHLCRITNVHEEGISNILIYLNSAVNPFVYFLFKKDVRRELGACLKRI
ncbi:octopamine receptor beta-2R-like [Actinia tenebrosa]|uniref:Octopamine receptor beta-2R-like n=1 Tax=Actinia tenebrosa TaxID=6105 RepID=A0A6P8J8W9_ACTTE|nr:octopamine receptor beta-2R-like [Actinia tenebrosa]